MSDTPGWIGFVDAHVQAFIRDSELLERNAQALEDWHRRKSFTGAYPDARAPLLRYLLERHFQEKLDLAKRWLFKRRWAARQSRRTRPFAHHPIPAHLSNQGPLT
jgi:hypothetical protein